MSFSILTNVASLQAQNYLEANQQFQTQTIAQVTSGLRIVNSGDDAAGLAIANGYRSDEAVLTQGIQNANNGLGQLQIADGGMNNISQLLDRASTLATESASGTFTGDRNVLNSEFQSVLTEINRQAQSIGLNTGGQFAKNLSVFIGGGEASNGISATSNGSVSVDLSQSTVDSKSLGLQGVQSIGVTGTDIGPNSATSVSHILANAANTSSEQNAGYTQFKITGPGFSGANQITLNVNLSGVTDADTLVTAVNSAIQAAGQGSQYATAFANAGVTAALNTDSTGKTQLTFNSSTTAFQVQAGDQVSNALMGNFSSGSTGAALTTTASGGANTANPADENIVGTAIAAPVVIGSTNNSLKVNVNGTATTLTLDSGNYNSLASLVANINKQLTAGSVGAAASLNSSNQIVLQASAASQSVAVEAPAGNDAAATLGFTDGQTSSSTPTLTTNDQITLQFQGGGLDSPVNVTLNQFQAGTTTMADALQNLQSQVAANSQLAAAGITVTTATAGSALAFTGANGQQFSVMATGDTANALGLGTFLAGTGNNIVSYSSATAGGAYDTSTTVNGTADLGISLNGGADQVISAALTGAGTDAAAGKVNGTVDVTAFGAGTDTAGKVTGAADVTAFSSANQTNALDALSLMVDGSQVDIAAADLGGLSSGSAVLGALNTALGTAGTASIDGSGHLVVTSASTGATSQVEVLGVGDGTSVTTASALTDLGLTASQTGTGADATSGTNALDALSLMVDGSQIDISAADLGGLSSGSAVLGALNTALGAAGTATIDGSGHLVVTSASTGATSQVEVLGVGDGTSVTTASALTDLGVTASQTGTGTNASETNVIQQLNSAIATNSTLVDAGLQAVDNGGKIEISSANSTNFRLNAYGSGDIGFGNSGVAFGSPEAAAQTSAAPTASPFFDAQGTTQTGGLAFNPVIYGSDNQTLSFSATDTSGAAHTVSVTLNSGNAGSLDQALATINTAIQATNDSTLQQIAAVGEDNSGTQKVNFVSNLANFNVTVGNVGASAGTEGVGDNTAQGTVVSGVQVGTGGTANISNQASAEAAVTALSNAVQSLGDAQAVVGRGENQFTYATNLAQSQLTNTQSAESTIRDADLASQAANLTKAQILIQAGVAALAQANSAPQQILSLLSGH